MNWLEELFVKYAAKRAGEKLGEFDKMDTKKWYQSKTILAAIVTFLINAYNLAIPLLASFGVTLPEIPAVLLTVLNAVFGSITIYGRSTAAKTIG